MPTAENEDSLNKGPVAISLMCKDMKINKNSCENKNKSCVSESRNNYMWFN